MSPKQQRGGEFEFRKRFKRIQYSLFLNRHNRKDPEEKGEGMAASYIVRIPKGMFLNEREGSGVIKLTLDQTRHPS